MKLTLEPGDREILVANLGLPAGASDDDLHAAVAQCLSRQPAATASAAIDHDLIAAAVRDERIPAQRADFWAQRFAEDPDGTRKKLERLQPGSAHYANQPPPGADDSYPADWLPESRVAPWPRPVPGAAPSRVVVE